jgi:transcription elongation factor SPT6
VARLDTICREKESAATLGTATSEGDAMVKGFATRSKKMCKDKLWHYGDYFGYATSMIDYRQVMDMKGYLNLIKEGNDAIKDKTPLLGRTDEGTTAKQQKKNTKNRSRRFDWDFYRTCVSEGLRSICYQFVLPPFRVGIKLEDTLTSKTGFSYDKTLPGEDGDDPDMEIGDPRQWVAPVIEGMSPIEFGSQLIDSGDLVSLAAAREDVAWDENPDLSDPLRACRYVAAMELAHEPRIRSQLRALYRSEAVITTRPTAKGMGAIDAFHEYYGLHLIKEKPVKEHFPMDESELEKRRARLNAEEVKEFDAALKKKETDSCIQYLSLLKAERSGDITLQVHLPYLDEGKEHDTLWYKKSPNTLSRDQQDLRKFLEALERVYLPANGDTDEWNEERRKILKMALVNYFLPQFEAETRRDLREISTRIGVEAAGKNLQLMAMEGPYRPSHLLGENRFIVPTGDLPIVGVCSSSDAKDGTFLAAVDGRGELSDHVAVPGGTSITSDHIREKVITFLLQTRPSAVVVGSSGGVGSRAMARRLGEVIAEATERWNNRLIQGQDEDDEDFEARINTFRMMHPNTDDDDEFLWKCNVDTVDDNVAQLFGRSVRGKKEFPDTAVNLKVAIATARWAKDPLCELAYTWSAASDAGVFGTEMLFLNIHPLQRLLPKPMLLREYERVLCNVTAEIGVDVNGACSYDHMHGLLTFVPGLGPRKANNLKQMVARIGGVVTSRKSILAKRLLGPIVYNNAAAFLRVRATDQLQDQMLHPLDDSRCHPDVYQRNRWAVKIAVDALEWGDNANPDDEFAISAIRDVMQNSREEVERLFHATKAEWEGVYGPTFNVSTWDPKVTVPAESWRDKVEELDIEAYADMIEADGSGKWLSQLTMVKWEFRLPYEDPRKPMEPPSGEKLFKLLTGESDATLCPGKEVTGTVVKNGDFGSQVKLEGDVPGFIPLRNLADDHVESAEDIVSVGTVVTALITQVKMDHMCVDLTLKKEDFRKKSSEWERPHSLPPLDDHFDRMAALKIDEEKDKERQARLEALRLTFGVTKIGGDTQAGEVTSGGVQARSGKVTRRACAHPAFRNASHDVVDKELKQSGEAMVGDALIRPSNKSCDSLAIHWMVRPGCIKVIEVLEQDKDTDASIGNRLLIKVCNIFVLPLPRIVRR